MSKAAPFMFAGAVGLALIALSPVPRAQDAAADGKAVFMDAKCNMCHAVPSHGIPAKTTSAKMKGPDIAGIDADPAALGKYLRKQAERKGNAHMKEFKGTDDDLRVLVAWLLEQR